MEAKVQLLGRVTYEGFAAAVPRGAVRGRAQHRSEGCRLDTLKDPEWQNTTVISEDVVERISELEAETDGVVLVAGSATLVRTLLEANLVDELRLMVFPTVLGRGKRLFPDGIDRLKLKLVESRPVGPDGVQVQIYRRAE
jgi:dihydrofolate reductase